MDERVESGKRARGAAPRSAHEAWAPAVDRPDPIVVLEEQARTRVPELVPIRYGRMLASPFAFFRGAAAVMALDLAGTPVTGLMVQCCGDAHLSNFGVFGSPERRLLFDVNDFDETLPGPWEWDLKRLAASLVVAGRDNGFRRSEQDEVARSAAAQYREAMRGFAAMGTLEVWYASLDVDAFVAEYGEQLGRRTVRRAQRGVARARTRDSMSAVRKLTTGVDGQVRIVDASPLIVPLRAFASDAERDEAFAELDALVRRYRRTLQPDRRRLVEQYQLVDVARKVVGVGSVGTRAWIALMFGRDTGDPLFLQLKEAQASVLEPHVGRSRFRHHGERVVAGQRLMQAASDIFLGWVRVPAGIDGAPHDYYGRQLRDWKVAAEIERMSPDIMGAYGRLCAWTLARAHARSGDRIAIAAYLGAGCVFDRAVAGFAQAYADQNERDYAALQVAVKDGRVSARPGV